MVATGKTAGAAEHMSVGKRETSVSASLPSEAENSCGIVNGTVGPGGPGPSERAGRPGRTDTRAYAVLGGGGVAGPGHGHEVPGPGIT